MKRGGKNPEKGDIIFGGSRGDMFLIRITGRRSFTHIHESNTIFWDETRLKREKSHAMVTLKGRFKIETGDKWNMLLLVDIKYSGIEVRIWL